jgi:hypothetical protein
MRLRSAARESGWFGSGSTRGVLAAGGRERSWLEAGPWRKRSAVHAYAFERHVCHALARQPIRQLQQIGGHCIEGTDLLAYLLATSAVNKARRGERARKRDSWALLDKLGVYRLQRTVRWTTATPIGGAMKDLGKPRSDRTNSGRRRLTDLPRPRHKWPQNAAIVVIPLTGAPQEQVADNLNAADQPSHGEPSRLDELTVPRIFHAHWLQQFLGSPRPGRPQATTADVAR